MLVVIELYLWNRIHIVMTVTLLFGSVWPVGILNKLKTKTAMLWCVALEETVFRCTSVVCAVFCYFTLEWVEHSCVTLQWSRLQCWVGRRVLYILVGLWDVIKIRIRIRIRRHCYIKKTDWALFKDTLWKPLFVLYNFAALKFRLCDTRYSEQSWNSSVLWSKFAPKCDTASQKTEENMLQY